MPIKCKLQYFNMRGRAEHIRMLVHLSEEKIDFTDERIAMEDWPKIKPDTPNGYLPVLHVWPGPVRVCESMPIARFIAKAGNLYGKKLIETTQIDEIATICHELREKVIEKKGQLKGKSEDEEKEELKTLRETKLDPVFKILNGKLLKCKNGDAFFLGDKISLADVMFFHVVEILQNTKPELLESIESKTKDFEKLGPLIERISKHDKMANYLKDRPQTSM